MGGFICIEGDYLYKGYFGNLLIGSYVVFLNVGFYFIVFKFFFILLNYFVIDIFGKEIVIIKEGEIFDDVFKIYIF